MSLRRLPRRLMLVSLLAGAGGVAAAHWFNIAANREDGLSVQAAHAAAADGAVTLIDIRRPDEWASTGVGEGAIPFDMRDLHFSNKLMTLAASPDAPIALICARGVRSRHMTARLTEAGFTNVTDVPEGMLGSGAGPGWLKSGLPVMRP
jgi:rhodanese-related sulfurtransferase